MKFKIKNIAINTGGVVVAVINKKDATEYALHNGDRVMIRNGKKRVVAIVDITNSEKYVKRGYIGCFEELSKLLRLKNSTIVQVDQAKKPNSLSYIKKKLKGGQLNYEEIESIVKDIVNGELTDIEMTYFVSGTYSNDLSDQEAADMTKAMIKTGTILKMNKYPIVDKHCIGGVPGNRTTMMVVPIIAAAGLTIPKTSSRAITSPAGTSDTVEVLTNVSFTLQQMKKIVRKTGGCLVWGGAINLAPADDKIIRVEHPLSIDPPGQLLASILAKKKSVSSTHVLVDLPVGKGSKLENMDDAVKLKKRFENIGKLLDMHIKVVITDGSAPIGNGIGPALEARDVLWTLKNDPKGCFDLRDKSIDLAGTLLEMGKKARKGEGKILAKKILESGKAYAKFIEIIKAQGGKEIAPEKIKVGKYQLTLKSTKDGKIVQISNKVVARMARTAGAPIDKAAGVYLHKNVGEEVQKGDNLITIYADDKQKLKFSKDIYDKMGAYEMK